MIHPLVAQLYFTRDEWQRGIDGVSPADAIKHIGAMNSISWLIGHMAWQEQKYWLELAQGKKPFPDLVARFAAGAPKNSPPLNEVVKIWFEVTRLTRPYLDRLTTADLEAELLRHGKPVGQSLGSAMLRLIYHYWHHTEKLNCQLPTSSQRLNLNPTFGKCAVLINPNFSCRAILAGLGSVMTAMTLRLPAT